MTFGAGVAESDSETVSVSSGFSFGEVVDVIAIKSRISCDIQKKSCGNIPSTSTNIAKPTAHTLFTFSPPLKRPLQALRPTIERRVRSEKIWGIMTSQSMAMFMSTVSVPSTLVSRPVMSVLHDSRRLAAGKLFVFHIWPISCLIHGDLSPEMLASIDRKRTHRHMIPYSIGEEREASLLETVTRIV